mmetsp:Transcript_43124/g.70602  ORF Transcript_43124/g.70602 Transcript_43124/m.70602 type:complete len:303 (+) Transcript_43124:1527-2435(+)
MCEGHGSEEEEKDGRSVCRYYLRGWCRNGKRCEFSHRRPLCRYGDRCRYGRWCRYSHKITPRVSRVGGTKPGRHNVRNRQRREKRRVLIAEAKVSLVRVKELEDQLKLEEKQKSELHDPQVKRLEAQLRLVQEEKERLEHKLQHKEKHCQQVYDIWSTQCQRAEQEAEEKGAKLEELEKKHSDLEGVAIEAELYETDLTDRLRQERNGNAELRCKVLDQQRALEREQKKTEQAVELGKQERADLEHRMESVLAQLQTQLQHIQEQVPVGYPTELALAQLQAQLQHAQRQLVLRGTAAGPAAP